MNCSYAISYNVDSGIELIDGLVTAGSVKKGQNITYLYSGQVNDRLVVTITFENAMMLEACKILVKQVGDSSTTLEPKVQSLHQNTPKPTLTFDLN